MKNSFLLDTQAFLWIMEGSSKLSLKSMDRIEKVIQNEGRLYVSAISLWEIGHLNAQGAFSLKTPCLQWVQEALQAPYVHLAPVTPEIAIESSFLPGTPPQNPVASLIIATARVLQVPLFTRDESILNYASQGHIQAFLS